jgi:hypothetical protein
MESLTKILFDFDKLPSKLVLLIFLLSGIILFVPAEYLAKVQLAKFNASYGQWVGISFIFSGCFLAITVITTIQNRLKRNNRNRSIEESITKNLKQLNRLEQSVLREFYINGSSTINLPGDHPTVVGLQDKGILRLAQSQLGGYFMTGFDMPFTLTGYAKSVIEKDPVLIGLQHDGRKMTEEVRTLILNSRPPWIRRANF